MQQKGFLWGFKPSPDPMGSTGHKTGILAVWGVLQCNAGLLLCVPTNGRMCRLQCRGSSWYQPWVEHYLLSSYSYSPPRSYTSKIVSYMHWNKLVSCTLSPIASCGALNASASSAAPSTSIHKCITIHQQQQHPTPWTYSLPFCSLSLDQL